jgi:hypothetical protein
LPSVTLGKAFAECKIAFAVCLRHTTKELIPVVSMIYSAIYPITLVLLQKLDRPFNYLYG